jgi:hypothetical protein
MTWRLGAGIAVIGLAQGCAPKCGEYTHQTGIEWDLVSDDDAPEAIDDYTLHEICGSKMGSIGYRDLSGDGVAQISFDGSHRDSHVAITLTSAIFQEVYLQGSALAVGNTLGTDDLLGQSDVFESSAYVLSNGVAVSGAFLTEGTLEILDTRYDDFWEADAYRIRFDLTFGEPGVSEFWYTAAGEDWIAIQ